MNAIMSISFHTRDHAHVLKVIDDTKKAHPNMTRSAIVRSLVVDGANARIYQEILDYAQEVINHNGLKDYNWREQYIALIRKSQGQT